MNNNFNPGNILGIAVGPVIMLLGAWIALKKLGILYKKPVIKEITEISITPLVEDGQGGIKSRSCLKFDINNPSSSENQVSAILQKSRTSNVLAKIEKINLAKMGITSIALLPDYEKVEKHIGGELLLTIEDARHKKTRKKFVFENYLKKVE
ncbi:hypothetical protein ACFLRM_02710 [Acidobacteriota bacterium]